MSVINSSQHLVALDMRSAFVALSKDLGFHGRNFRYIVDRLRHEGVYLLTTVLPGLSKHILACIEVGVWKPFEFTGKTSPIKTKGRERYTYFLYDELRSIFNKDLDCALNLWRVRQLCEYLYKLCLPFDSEALGEASEKFLTTESSLSYCPTFAQQMRKTAEAMFKQTFKLTISDVAPLCRFGPGTFAEYGSSSFEGVTLQQKKDYLDGVYDPKFDAVKGAFRSRKTSITTGKLKRLIGRELPAVSEVLFVPKDSRGPRTIVREPAGHIFWQMGLFHAMTQALTRDTKGRIQFISQEKFRDLAQQSSITKNYATIDLKEASDSVSFGLAQSVFRNCSALAVSFRLARTTKCVVPGKPEPHTLRKLSGMGSGFTFPVMAALIFTAIITAAPKHLRAKLKSDVYVYGDDIIVPTWALKYAYRGLSLAGFTINKEKSFVNSNFRESCGGDYYLGNCVTPVRLKQQFVDNRVKGLRVFPSNSQENNAFILKLERHCRELVKNGLILLAGYYYRVIERSLGFVLPLGSGVTPVLCRYNLVPQRYYPSEHRVVMPSACTERTVRAGLDRSFKQKLLTLTEDSLGVNESQPLGWDSARYKLSLKHVWVSDLLLTGTDQPSQG